MKESNPFFSIIIPTYNRAQLVRRLLDSFQQQTYQGFEVIVVDDGGTDTTREVVESMQDPRFNYIWKENGERAAARNFGRKMAKGSYLVYFDSDDLALGHYLEDARRKISKYCNPPVYASSYRWQNDKGKVIREVILPDDLSRTLYRGNILSPICVFLRNDIAQKHQFNEDLELTASEDWQLWLRLASRYPFVVGKNITAVLMDHGGRSVRNLSSHSVLRRRERLVETLSEDDAFLSEFGDKLAYIKADGLNYAALHAALAGEGRSKVMGLLMRSLIARPGNFLHKRTWATLKHTLYR